MSDFFRSNASCIVFVMNWLGQQIQSIHESLMLISIIISHLFTNYYIKKKKKTRQKRKEKNYNTRKKKMRSEKKKKKKKKKKLN